MKKFLYFLLLPLFCSCTNSLLEEDEAIADKFVEVSFDLGGDYDIEFENLTRASVEDGDLVGISVYESSYDYPYAYGLFNGAPTGNLLLKANHTYIFDCRVVKDGVSKVYKTSEGYSNPFLHRNVGSASLYRTSISTGFVYSSTLSGLLNDYIDLDSFSGKIDGTRSGKIITYVGTLSGYHSMENGVVKLSLKCIKAPKVTLNFTSDIPDGQVTGSMKYSGYKTLTWSLTNARTLTFQRDAAPVNKILDGTWWGGVEQLDFSMTWQRGPEANTFVTTHRDVTLKKTLNLDNDKNYTVNLHFRGQSDSDPEVWVGVDTDPDHSGDLDEEDDSNE